MAGVTGITSKFKHKVKCTYLSFAMNLVPHGAELPPKPPEDLNFSHDNSDYDYDHRQQEGKHVYCDPTFEASCFSTDLHLLTQRDLNDLVHDLNLSKKQTEPLGSRLKAWNLLHLENEICLFLNC
jgi:hypothetical protein